MLIELETSNQRGEISADIGYMSQPRYRFMHPAFHCLNLNTN